MTWLSLILGLVKLVNGIMAHIERQRLIQAGEAAAINRALLLLEGRVRAARKARENVDSSEGAIGSDPDNRDTHGV